MFCLVLVCSSLLAVAPDGDSTSATPSPASDADLKTYASLRSNVGQDSPAHVKLALWCEAHGLDAERLKHLALAVLTDPKNATARGLMGLVAYRDRWERPEQVSRRIEADLALTARLAEYNARRENLIGRHGIDDHTLKASRAAAAAHDALGLWCRKNNLDAEARAHFTSAAVLDPYSESAWKHLGYVKSGGRWLSREQLAALEREGMAQSRADKRWEPLLRKWRGWLALPEKRDEALALIDDLADPRAAAAIVRVFRDGDPAHEEIAIKMLAKISSTFATRSIAELAVLGKNQAVRSAAIDALRSRPPRDYIGMLVDEIHAPMRYQFEPVRGPGSPGALAIETPRFKMLRTYDAPAVFQPGTNFYGYAGYDANGMPIIASGKELRRLSTEKLPGYDIAALEQRTLAMIASANFKATVSHQQMVSDVQAIEESNAQTSAANARIAASLQDAASAPKLDPGDEDSWQRWRYDQLGYRYDPPPQAVVAVNASIQSPSPSIRSCFVAGTPVRTIHGLRPIETLQVGDQVLSQDTGRGALSFQPIMVVHHNPPSATLRLELDNGETLVPSIYHRFWRAGLGWVIARDLKPGDILRTLEGRTRIKTITAGPVDPVFNLDVAESRTFFVGAHGALVHDNTFPVSPTTPFDAEPVFEMIRPTVPTDTPDLLAIARETGVFKPLEITALEEVLDDYHATNRLQGHLSVTLEQDGRPIGFAYYAPAAMTDRTWYLYWIAVDRSIQARGLGSRLLHWAEDEIAVLNGRLLLIETSGLPHYAPTRRFYAKHGYDVACRLAGYYADGDDLVVFGKRFPLRTRSS